MRRQVANSPRIISNDLSRVGVAERLHRGNVSVCHFNIFYQYQHVYRRLAVHAGNCRAPNVLDIKRICSKSFFHILRYHQKLFWPLRIIRNNVIHAVFIILTHARHYIT